MAAVPEKRHEGGFTLLEVLIVVLIVGIVSGLAVIAVRDDPGERVATEAQRLSALLTLASQESVLQSRELAVEFGRDGYRFLVLEEDGWTEHDDPVFRARTLPDNITLQPVIEGDDVARRAARGRREPRIYLLSGGEMTPFAITFRHAGREDVRYVLSGDAAGRIALDEADAR
ncbi:MAG: type II secretion system minor pseudopilin GspH [Gammaproteobacteria bacterium]|nr:type II secretion system minor pseudopilin GspH [Gammaproteobacteria bacterium]